MSLLLISVALVSVHLTGSYTTKITSSKELSCLKLKYCLQKRWHFPRAAVDCLCYTDMKKELRTSCLFSHFSSFFFFFFFCAPPSPFYIIQVFSIPLSCHTSSLHVCGLLFYPPLVLQGTNWQYLNVFKHPPLTIAFMCLCLRSYIAI